MDDAMFKKLEESFKNTVDQALEENLKSVLGPMVAEETKSIVQKMQLERSIFGYDRSGLSDEQKKDFATIVKNVAFGRQKANEALIEESDPRGGYLVPVEVANAIVRIAATVGLAMGQVTKWPMGTDQLDIPAYTGAFLEGEYLGVDEAGDVTAITFEQASLIIKKWQLAFVVGNDLLADASVNLADWLLALAAEALANRADKMVFAGTAPFTGVLNHADVTVHTMASTKTDFEDFDLVEASDMIANLEESLLDGAAFYMHRTVWAKLRSKNTSGNYVFGGFNQDIAKVEKEGGRRAAGYIMGYPVYTVRHLPANSATAVSTKFAIFGNLKAVAYGDRGDLRVAQHSSGSFGGKEIALSDQMGLVIKHRHAFVVTLPAAFVVARTAAS